jgi:hypothetical protein
MLHLSWYKAAEKISGGEGTRKKKYEDDVFLILDLRTGKDGAGTERKRAGLRRPSGDGCPKGF